MARKPNYDHLSIVGTAAASEADQSPIPNAKPQGKAGDAAEESHLITHRTHHTMVYHSPEAHKALARYALELSGHKAKVKVHDLWVRAMQEFCEREGITVTVRTEPKGRE